MRTSRRSEQQKAIQIEIENTETEEESTESEKFTEEQLLSKTNAELKTILGEFDGAPSGSGKTKSELVQLILDAQG